MVTGASDCSYPQLSEPGLMKYGAVNVVSHLEAQVSFCGGVILLVRILTAPKNPIAAANPNV